MSGVGLRSIDHAKNYALSVTVSGAFLELRTALKSTPKSPRRRTL